MSDVRPLGTEEAQRIVDAALEDALSGLAAIELLGDAIARDFATRHLDEIATLHRVLMARVTEARKGSAECRKRERRLVSTGEIACPTCGVRNG